MEFAWAVQIASGTRTAAIPSIKVGITNNFILFLVIKTLVGCDQ